jgi:hypothetical protein
MNFRSFAGQATAAAPASDDGGAPAPARAGAATLSDVMFKLFIGGLLAYLIYDKAQGSRPAPGPSPEKPDPAAVALGETYGHALLNAAAESLELGSKASWSNALEAKAGNRKSFDAGIQAAIDPLAIEMSKRFGAADATPLDPAKSTTLRKFWHDLSVGIRGAAR